VVVTVLGGVVLGLIGLAVEKRPRRYQLLFTLPAIVVTLQIALRIENGGQFLAILYASMLVVAAIGKVRRRLVRGRDSSVDAEPNPD